jgi:hypothetical protein
MFSDVYSIIREAVTEFLVEMLGVFGMCPRDVSRCVCGVFSYCSVIMLKKCLQMRDDVEKLRGIIRGDIYKLGDTVLLHWTEFSIIR